ncbi:MAG: pyridoxal phosphate-dependent decarboxylase family protein, partial [Phycisphaerales bacterium JB061]
MDESPPHMSPDAFREQAIRAVEAVADYMRRVETLPARPPTKPGDVLKHIPESANESPGDAHEWTRIFDDLERIVIPNMTHWQSPNFFGYFPCNSTGPAIIGELLSAGFGQQGMLWATSPAASELERALLDQMGRAMGLPESFLSASETGGGCIQSTASDATLAAMVAGRRRVSDNGADFHKTTVYASSQTHSSFIKAALITGLASTVTDTSRVRTIETDDRLRMDPAKLEAAIRED